MPTTVLAFRDLLFELVGLWGQEELLIHCVARKEGVEKALLQHRCEADTEWSRSTYTVRPSERGSEEEVILSENPLRLPFFRRSTSGDDRQFEVNFMFIVAAV